MKTDTGNNLVEIYSGPSVEAGIVKSYLSDSGIEAYLKDEYMGTIAPWNVSAGGANPVKIFVPDSEMEQAKKLVDEYFNHINKNL
ncbi:DUF2007 domain-containing protein [Plebeiibacterium marinum]|uniref:DUF2007 domain-containing protein n=1 Tax=Plebeiibacterium marinum TaxID=2992111 RepID=A0AAE3ME30_9BACT|nr:DUF2007 domain-containing protein [Plebeiobacterium marinum]MCW3805905.1 DUF2007 domain-containing protein [Plebeiobacterium marinum]